MIDAENFERIKRRIARLAREGKLKKGKEAESRPTFSGVTDNG